MQTVFSYFFCLLLLTLFHSYFVTSMTKSFCASTQQSEQGTRAAQKTKSGGALYTLHGTYISPIVVSL